MIEHEIETLTQEILSVCIGKNSTVIIGSLLHALRHVAQLSQEPQTRAAIAEILRAQAHDLDPEAKGLH